MKEKSNNQKINGILNMDKYLTNLDWNQDPRNQLQLKKEKKSCGNN